MANVRGKKGTTDRARPLDRVREEVKPSFGWSEDTTCHYLLLDLPGFRKQEIKIQIDDSGHVNISGESQVSQNRYIFVEQSYKAPDNSDIRKTSGSLEDGLLTVTIPKQVIEAISEVKTQNKDATTDDHTKNASQEEENKKARNEHMKAADQEEKGRDHGRDHQMPENKRSDEQFHREMFSGDILQKYEEERSMIRTAMQMVSKNKGIIITAVLAFSLGVLVARYSGSGRHDETLD